MPQRCVPLLRSRSPLLRGCLQGGESRVPIIPCDGEASPLVTSIEVKFTDIGVSQMPKSGAPMPDDDIAILVSWIDEGAGVHSCEEAEEGMTATDGFDGDTEDAGSTEPDDASADDDAASAEDIGPEQDGTKTALRCACHRRGARFGARDDAIASKGLGGLSRWQTPS